MRLSQYLFIISLLFILNPGLYAVKEVKEFGKTERIWPDMDTPLNGVQYIHGKDGSLDITLAENEYEIKTQSAAELLLHFNKYDKRLKATGNAANSDEVDKYSLKRKKFTYDKNNKIFGPSSARFDLPSSTIEFRPKKGSLFTESRYTGDFTIEFWIKPSILGDGEVILKRFGPVVENGEVTKYSGVLCQIKNKRLSWEFHNVFYAYKSEKNFGKLKRNYKKLVKIMGRKRLDKNQWHHHALSFNASTGELTYYIDGVVENSIYATDNEQYNGTILNMAFYPQEKSLLTIGHKYYGFIDELLISRRAKMNRKKLIIPILQQYEIAKQQGNKDNEEIGETKIPLSTKHNTFFNISKYVPEGILTSNVMDLQQKGTYLKRVKINMESKNGSYIILQYRMSNNDFNLSASEDQREDLKWKSLDVNSFYRIQELKKTKGKYFQWRALFKSGGYGKYSPILKDIAFEFEIDTKPKAPTGLVAFSHEGRVTLKWNGSIEKDIEKYKVYYGMEAGNYLYIREMTADKIIQDMKIDKIIKREPEQVYINEIPNRMKPEYQVENLISNEVYYFVITAIDRNGHESDFSKEVYVRVRPGY